MGNALLSTHWLLDHTEVSIVVDNEAVYDIAINALKIKRPSYEHLNRLIAKAISSMTASLRFDGELNVDLNEFQTNLVPFPRLHFMTNSIAPVISASLKSTEKFTVQDVTDQAVNRTYFMVKYPDFDPAEDKYMAISLNFRGDIKAKDSNKVIQWLKDNNKVSFVDWCPTGFKVGLNDEPPAIVKGRPCTKHRQLLYDLKQRRGEPSLLATCDCQVRSYVQPARIRPLVCR